MTVGKPLKIKIWQNRKQNTNLGRFWSPEHEYIRIFLVWLKFKMAAAAILDGLNL